MTRPMAFLFFLMAGVSWLLFLENKAVRADQAEMKEAYAEFMAREVGGRPLSERIRPETLAVFKTSRGVVGCALMLDGGVHGK